VEPGLPLGSAHLADNNNYGKTVSLSCQGEVNAVSPFCNVASRAVEVENLKVEKVNRAVVDPRGSQQHT
jgi:hypothetical protein